MRTRPPWKLLIIMMLLGGCQPSAEERAAVHLAEFQRAYTPVYESSRALDVYAVQQGIWSLGDAGKPFQADYDELSKRRDEIDALIVKGNELIHHPDTAAAAVQSLADARAKVDALAPDVAALRAKLTAAGAKVP